MPEGVESQITVSEMADLLAYIKIGDTWMVAFQSNPLAP